MANIGTFSADKDGFTGTLRTLTLEWGFPVADDRRMFEKLCLEGFQSGLSWRTILAKPQNFRAAFHGFDFELVAAFTERDVARLLQDPGIVRHRGKIEAVIHNAGRACEMVEREGSLAEPQTVSTSPTHWRCRRI